MAGFDPPLGMDAGRTEIERWIGSNLSPAPSTTAELSYERMESQSGECLAVIYQPLDHTRLGHWRDCAIVSAFAHTLRGASSILDIGPGDGWPSLRIAHRFDRIVGIDPSPRRVRVQRENARRLGIENVEFLEMDALSLDFADGSFGGVAAASSIEQTGDPGRALREVFRVLKPGGALAMCFEDYGTYFPDSDGDEDLWTDVTEAHPALFYQRRTKTPARETKYALFLDGELLDGDSEVAACIRSLSADEAGLENLPSLDDAPSLPDWADVSFFERLAPCIREAKYFELKHLTSATLDSLLEAAGFVEIRHFDERFPGLTQFFNAAHDEGRLGELKPVFETVSEIFGVATVEAARPGPGDFAVARKPK